MLSLAMKRLLRFSVSFLVIAAAAYWTVLPFCGLLYGCGCTFESGIRYCNIFITGQPHCPWCQLGTLAFWSVFAGNLALTAPVIWIGLSRIQNSFSVGLASGAAGYLLWASLAGLVLALYFGYPALYGLRIG